MDKIRIVLLDDHRMFRDGVKHVLSDEENIEIIGEVGNGRDLYDLLEQKRPDIIITDISLPDISGIDITSDITSRYDDIKILILSMHTREEFIVKALSAGASGYLPKETSIKELLEAIKVISEGGRYYNRDISDTIINSVIMKMKTDEKTESIPSLTKREREIVTLVVEGLTNKEIAARLFISIRTVDSHKTNILQKLKLKSSVELVKYAIKNKLVKIDLT